MDHHLENDIKSHLDFACAKLKDTAKELGATKRLVDTRMFIWKIGNFDQVLKQATNEQKEELESDPFYSTTTESYGYKLQVSVYPNGIDQNSHLSVFIAVKRGDYDAMLLWPLKKKVTFTLIDQQEDPNQRENVIMQFITGNFPEDFKRPLQEESTGIGFPEFVSHEKLNSRRYIVDDTLFLQVEVGPPSSWFACSSQILNCRGLGQISKWLKGHLQSRKTLIWTKKGEQEYLLINIGLTYIPFRSESTHNRLQITAPDLPYLLYEVRDNSMAFLLKEVVKYMSLKRNKKKNKQTKKPEMATK